MSTHGLNFAQYLNIRSATTPVFSPAGDRVAFLSDITGNFQVWSIEAAAASSGWPAQLTYLDNKVWEIHGTPAAPYLLAVSDVGGNERQQFYLVSNFGINEQGQSIYDGLSSDSG